MRGYLFSRSNAESLDVAFCIQEVLRSYFELIRQKGTLAPTANHKPGHPVQNLTNCLTWIAKFTNCTEKLVLSLSGWADDDDELTMMTN